jgi:hypothetical protein
VGAFALAPPWPNPGIGVIHLAVSTPGPAWVRLAVFDVQGREVALLADGDMPPGRHEINWDGTARGVRVPAGIYFARATANGQTQVQRLVLSK